ncbi:uncharacterized protein LOC141684877 [Apium graveolens]|uniref:uncharacterized protein LOC141684877 n=1 Tax=Apium graveolens TaxID=4045 RepID=UPI003D7BDF49
MIDGKLALMKEDTRAVAKCFANAIAGDPISRAALEMEANLLKEAGETMLHVESKKGVVENVRFIKQTALYLAADRGHAQVVEALLDAARRNLPSASANDDTLHNPISSFQDFIRQANGQMGNTALHLAVLTDNVAIVKLLVKADPNDKTPVYIAAENGFKDVVKEMCTSCAALSLDGPAKRWSTGAEFEALFCRTDEFGSTVLQLVVERNNADAVRLILQEDPACQHGREIKRNGLMRLIYKAIDNGFVDVLCLLEGARGLVTFTEDNGCTLLHYAVYHEFDSVLGAIIEAKENVGHQFVYENMVQTPFHVAVECGYASTLVPPLSSASKADNSPYTAVNKDDQNILHLAAAGNRFTMPGGLRQSGEVDEGLVALTKKTAFHAFMVSDALALLLSTSSLFFYFLESMYEDPHQVSKLNAASTVLNIVS